MHASDHEAHTPRSTERLVALREELRGKKDLYWAEQVDIQSRIAIVWTQFAKGPMDEAMTILCDATDAEYKTEKVSVTPGPLAPARELHGAMLLRHGKAEEALAAFEATMAKEPNRLRAPRRPPPWATMPRRGSFTTPQWPRRRMEA